MSVDWGDRLEKVGNTFLFGFGDKVLDGFIPQYLCMVDLDVCYDYIVNDEDLLAKVPEKYWPKIKKIAKVSKYQLSYDKIISELRKNRPDVLSIIINTPNGEAWLQKQLSNCQRKLTEP
jgi:hypothetical protein